MGTAELGVPILQALQKQPDWEVVAVVSQPDRPRGRNLEVQPTPIKQAAMAAGLPVLQPERARNPEFIEALKKLAPELIVVVAYGQILPQSILDVPRFGCVNVHTSLLPKYRGAAPIQWAILNGDAETGVTIMKMDAGMDTGPILSQKRTEISASDNAQTLHDRLGAIGAELIVPTIREYTAGKIQPQVQPEGASHARKISKEDGRIDWSKPARQIWNQVRAFTPWPGAFTFQGDDAKPRLLKIWRAEVEANRQGAPGEILDANSRGIVVATGQGALRILELQREGGRRMSAAEFLAGAHLQSGEQFSKHTV